MPNDWTDAPFARVYVTLADDHPGVWASDELLAWYVRLLVGADRFFPASTPIPRDVPQSVLDSLESDEVVDVEGVRYRIRGLSKLRSTRGSAGGRARARDAVRVAGRFAGPDDAGSDAGNGSESLVDTAGRPLVADADAPTLANQRTSVHTYRHTDEESPPNVGDSSSSSSTPRAPAPAPAREGGAVADDPTEPLTPGQRAAMVRAHGTDDADCDEPTLHPLHHRFYPGVGWVCLLCERTDTRSFDDLFAEAGGKIPPRSGGSPF